MLVLLEEGALRHGVYQSRCQDVRANNGTASSDKMFWTIIITSTPIDLAPLQCYFPSRLSVLS